MNPRRFHHLLLMALVLGLTLSIADAQSFRVQCPPSTITHPDPANSGINSTVLNYSGPTQFTCSVQNGCKDYCTAVNNCSGTTGAAGNVGYLVPANTVNGGIKCQQVSGGDGYATMADGTQTYTFSFGPLSGLADIMKGLPGTETPSVFNSLYTGTSSLQPGDPATAVDAASGNLSAFSFNGAVGLAPDIPAIVTITDILEGALPAGVPALSCPASASNPLSRRVTVYTNTPIGLPVGSPVVISNTTGTTTPAGYLGTFTITCVDNNVMDPNGQNSFAFTYFAGTAGLASNVGNFNAGTAAAVATIDGHVDPRPIMDVAVMNGNIPAPLIAFDEDDEMFLTLTNVGMIMRPDLFEQHTIHFHGYPNASSFYDGVPDASVAINIGGSFTYYYMAPDAGTYFWHCHITPPEHLQMGMVGQLYIRPRQNRVPVGRSLYTALQNQQLDPRTKCDTSSDVLCSNLLPAVNPGATRAATGNYAYNDGDGSTHYDVEYPLQMHGFDPNFHFVGMTFNPESFGDMKDKYALLNGRSYPDTINPAPLETQTTDGSNHFSQPLSSIINIPVGGKALLRISDLNVTEYHTLASLGIPMKVIALNAKLLRDQKGNNLYYNTNSITLGGGESLDVILDASDTTKYMAGQIFYLYTPNLDHLSNDAENFGGLMTEVHICGSVSGGTTFGNTCTN